MYYLHLKFIIATSFHLVKKDLFEIDSITIPKIFKSALKLLSCLVFLLGFYTAAHSQTSTLRVVAISEDEGTPVISATVVLSIPDGDTLKVGVTDVHGFAELSNVSPGSYQVSVSYIGFERNTSIVELNPGQVTIIRPELRRDTAMLDELVVSVKRGSVQREAGMQTVTPEDLSRVPSPGPGGDLTMYLQSLPSVVTTGDRGGELHIRGGTPSQNLVLVENMPVIKPFHISNLFSAFPQDALSSVDVYAGGFGAEYSGATSAVLDVNLRQGNMRRFQSKSAVSPYILSFQAEGPLKKDEQSFLLMGRYSVIEETAPKLTPDDVPLNFYDLIARYSINWDNVVCNFTGMHTNDSGRINPVRSVVLTWSNTVIGTRCLGFSEELNHAVDFTMGYTGYSSTEKGIDDFGRESNVSMGYMRMDNRAQFFGLPSSYGFKLEFINYSALLDEPFAENRGEEVRFSGLSASLDETFVTFSLYAALDWQITDNVLIKPGLTSQLNLRDIVPTFEPRLRMFWNPNGNDDIEFSLAAGRYVQMYEAINDERDAGTVFYVYKPTNPDDPLTESLHGIIGYRHQLNEWLGINLEGYVKDQKNIPVARWTREPGNTLETGLVEANTLGFDAQLEINFRQFFLSAGYGLSEVTYEAPSEELVAWIDRPVFSYNPAHDRRHQLNVVSSLAMGKYEASLNWQFSSGSPFTRLFAIDLGLLGLPRQNPIENRGTAMTLFSEPFDGKLPSFQRLDVSLNRNFEISRLFHIETEIGAINTFNATNVFYFDVNTLQQVNQLGLMPYLSITTKIL